jgi:chromosome segregation ATPase
LDPVSNSAPITQDEFQALEQKVLRAVEIVRREREARAAAEAEASALRAQLDELTSTSNAAQTQLTTLNQEREAVKLRVEKMMQQIDELL